MKNLMAITVVALLLAACGERDQSLPATASKSDTHSWEGTKGSFMDKGWTAGNKTTWEAHLRTRAQNQNEYVKVN